MDIVIDKRETDIIYVDKANLHNANNDEVIKFVNTNKEDINNNNYNTIINILSGFYNLNKTEAITLKFIMFNHGAIYYKQVLNVISIITSKSTSTIDRALTSLKNKRLIYCTKDNEVKVSSSIKVDINKVTNAKFIIIELNPEITSNGISI